MYYDFNIKVKENKNFKKILKTSVFYLWLIFIFNENWPWFQNTSFSNYLDEAEFIWDWLSNYEERWEKRYKKSLNDTLKMY